MCVLWVEFSHSSSFPTPSCVVLLLLSSHAACVHVVFSGCTLAFSIPVSDATPLQAPPPPEEPPSGAPARLKISVSSAQLPEPMELLVALDCGASFPPDGTVVLPLGSTVCFFPFTAERMIEAYHGIPPRDSLRFVIHHKLVITN